jgi:YVTN family beta-propeller protein
MIEISRYSMPARRLTQGTLVAALVALAGCGSNYRPTTTPITPTGPASQPGSYAFVISAPSATASGIGTVIDYSGDTVMATAPIGPGPFAFAINANGTEAWSMNIDGTLSNIPVSTNLQQKNVYVTTLNSYTGIDPIVAVFAGANGEYALDVRGNQLDVLNGSPAAALKLQLPVDPTPVTMVGSGLAQRYYVISQTIPYLTTTTVDGNTVQGGVACNVDAHAPELASQLGFADGMETTGYTISSHIQVGVCPVYAVETTDDRRVFVLNRGSDTVSVINSQTNAIDSCTPFTNQNGQPVTCHPSLPVTPAAGQIHAGPVYAEYNVATAQLVVANYDGNSISIIDVSTDEYGNDSPTFGTTYTVPVGNHPSAVTVLADGSRAYVANQSDQTVTIVNLSSHTVEKTLPIYGHPRTVVSTQNSLYGKVYVASPDSPYITILRTDQDIVDTTVLVQGNAIDVRATSPDAATANANVVSRLPGAGQPCFLSPEQLGGASGMTIANCRVQDPTLLTATMKK